MYSISVPAPQARGGQMTNYQLCADRENIQRFITEITKDWHQFSDQAGKFEIRCLGERRTPTASSDRQPRTKERSL